MNFTKFRTVTSLNNKFQRTPNLTISSEQFYAFDASSVKKIPKTPVIEFFATKCRSGWFL